MIKDVNPQAIAKQLDISIPVIRAEEDSKDDIKVKHVISSIVQGSDGTVYIGTVTKSIDAAALKNTNRQTDDIQDVQSHALRILQLIEAENSSVSVVDTTNEQSIVSSSSNTAIAQVPSLKKFWLPFIQYPPAASTTPSWAETFVIANDWSDCPFGKFNSTFFVDKMRNDGNSTYDFYVVKVNQQTVAGKNNCSNSIYTVDNILTRINLGYRFQQLYAYGYPLQNRWTQPAG
jgi:hypothetical protein